MKGAPPGTTATERGADSGRLGGRDGRSATLVGADEADALDERVGHGDLPCQWQGFGDNHDLHFGSGEVLRGGGERAVLAPIPVAEVVDGMHPALECEDGDDENERHRQRTPRATRPDERHHGHRQHQRPGHAGPA